MRYQCQEKINISWSPSFAYAIGLIVSDGNLSKDGRNMSFTSKDIEQIDSLKTALGIDNKTRKIKRKNEYFVVHFGDKIFYEFLNDIGITSAKSKTIKAVDISDYFFADFLRGVFDGDGSFYTFSDKRWPNSSGFRMSFASASTPFLLWLKEKLSSLYLTKGFIKQGGGVMILEYVKGDTRKLFNVMYHNKDVLCLSRKYLKVKKALDRDSIHGKLNLQIQRTPR